MPKYRVFELAKEFGATSKVILEILSRNNVAVKNHMSSVDEEGKKIIERTFARKSDAHASSAPVVAEEKAPVKKPPVTAERPKPVTPPVKVQPVVEKTVKPQQPAIQQPQTPVKKELFKPKTEYRPKPVAGNNPPAGKVPYQPKPQQQGNQNRTSSGQQHNRVPYQPQGQKHDHQQKQPYVPKKDNQGKPPYRPNTTQNRNDNRQDNNAPRYQNQNAPQRKFDTPYTPAHKKPSSTPTPAATSHTDNSNNKFHQSKKKNKYPDKRFDRRDNADKVKSGNKPLKAGAFIMPTVNMQKPTRVEIPEFLTVKEFADALKREVTEIIKTLMGLGVMATINQEIDFDTAVLVGSELKVEVEMLPPEQDPTEVPEAEDDPKKRLPRAPVVTIMGHVDHGKTSLLDTIRKTNVTAREAGGITQHIGAYQVNYQGKKIVFLDTPGHEAFTSMRARGAQVTDIAILVVAADDGVMPQTIEAINHAKSAGVPIIVAINKIDKENAAPDRVKQQLSEHDLLAEDWGGQTIMVPVSAHQKIGLTDLLEMILLVAEMQDLKANPNIPGQGTIIEAQLDKGRGPVATVLVQKGTLRVGDTILAGTAYGKVRAMVNERGELLKKAGPSTPVEVLGLSDVPMAGDILNVTDEKIARSVAEKRTAKRRTEELQQNSKVSLDDIFRQIQDGKLKDLNIVVKADVQGTIEALRQSLENIKNDEVKVVIVHSGVGAINETDVMLASASNALIIGFNVRPDANARKAAETEKVDIRMYRVIYDALNDVEAAIKGMLAPKYKEVVQGRAEVRQIITISKMIIAGCYVTEGKITRTSKIRLLRDDIVVHEGEIESLRRFKDDVKEVATGYECGVTLEKFRDVKEGDIIEAYVMEEIKQ